VDAPQRAAGEPTVVMEGRRRYWRDWLIAAGSVIPLIGVAFPLYLAWRDDRQGWVRACAVLVVGAVAVFPLSDAGGTIDGAVILAVWLGGITAAIVLASTVSPENRRASGEDLAARRGAARRTRSLARMLSVAAINLEDPRPRGGTAFTEPIVLVEGVHRSMYVLHDRDDRPLGQIQPADGCPPAYRARYELLGPDGSRLLAMHIAQRRGAHADVILAADDAELVRLQPADAHDEPLTGQTRHPRRLGRLGFGLRWLLSGEQRIGQVRRSHRRRHKMRVIADASGAEVARVVRVRGGAGPAGTERAFVIEISDGADDRIRAAAMLVGVLWDWYIISWDAGGG
jgi:hypothetical protein